MIILLYAQDGHILLMGCEIMILLNGNIPSEI